MADYMWQFSVQFPLQQLWLQVITSCISCITCSLYFILLVVLVLQWNFCLYKCDSFLCSSHYNSCDCRLSERSLFRTYLNRGSSALSIHQGSQQPCWRTRPRLRPCRPARPRRPRRPVTSCPTSQSCWHGSRRLHRTRDNTVIPQPVSYTHLTLPTTPYV